LAGWHEWAGWSRDPWVTTGQALTRLVEVIEWRLGEITGGKFGCIDVYLSGGNVVCPGCTATSTIWLNPNTEFGDTHNHGRQISRNRPGENG
jgi:hypothetical protein